MATPLSLQSTRPALIDQLREEHASAAVQALGVVGFALLTALGAQVRVFLPGLEVPLTFQTLAVYSSGLYLGWRNGLLAQLLYVALGFFWPVYQGDGTGMAYFAGTVTAGYLLGYPLSAAAIGFLSKRWNALSGSVLAMIAGSLVLFTCGVTWLHFAADHATWGTSIMNGWLVFLPVDLAKIVLVGLAYTATRRFL